MRVGFDAPEGADHRAVQRVVLNRRCRVVALDEAGRYVVEGEERDLRAVLLRLDIDPDPLLAGGG